MDQTPHGWTVLDRELGVLSYTYSFAPGSTANAFAARMKDGRMLVVSVPSRVEPGVFDDLLTFGEVGAVAVNNGFHHLGLPEWHLRFPDARFFADPLAAKRIAKKNECAPDLEPIDALQDLLGDDVHFTRVPNTKMGESWACARTSNGHAWYTSDVLSNLRALPSKFFIRMFFKMTGTRAGFGVFHTGLKFIVNDKKATLLQLSNEMNARSPTIIVPGHGDLLDDDGLPERTRAVIAAAL